MNARTSRIATRIETALADLAPVRLREDEVAPLATRWRTTFAARVHAATGQATHLGFDWHAFSYDFVHALEGEPAFEAYRARQRPQVFHVLYGETMTEGYRCEGDTLPTFAEMQMLDAYVVPATFAWTMMFTHEQDSLGPYFTTREWATEREARA